MTAGTAALVALGAGAGAALRFVVARWLDARWPWGVLLVNLVGSFVLGLLVGAGVRADALALLGTGLCGGLTTYSTFAVQAVEGGPRRGTAYVVATVAGCLLTATLGHLVGLVVS